MDIMLQIDTMHSIWLRINLMGMLFVGRLADGQRAATANEMRMPTDSRTHCSQRTLSEVYRPTRPID
jgi:hypothetical protein